METVYDLSDDNDTITFAWENKVLDRARLDTLAAEIRLRVQHPKPPA